MADPARTPLVSILINNYNYARFVGEAIESALDQSHPRVEVVVVDDGSKDESRAVISRYGDRITTIFKANGGQGSACNAGFAACSGSVVCFLDADDLLKHEAASRAAEAFAQPDLAQWRTPLELVDGESRSLGGLYPEGQLAVGDLKDRALAFGPWSYQVVPTSGNFWHRSYLEQVMPMPEADFRYSADEYLSCIAPFYGDIGASPVPAACYRSHGKNNYLRFGLAIDDVVNDSFHFERIIRVLTEHGQRLGLEVDPEKWMRRDWRQQLRRFLLHRAGLTKTPTPVENLLGAALADQTAPLKKAVLLPLLAAVAFFPTQSSSALGLKLLARR